jgi:Secretion system C-terminal sorting domain/Putative serine esterase (DUF676)
MGLLCIALSIPFCAIAQNTDTLNIEMDDTTTYTQVMDKMFSGLISNRVPYKALAERAFSWIDLKNITSDSIITNETLEQAALQLELASYASLPLSYNKIVEQNKLSYIRGELNLTAIQYNFSSIDSTALQDGRMSFINNVLIDNNGVLPYKTHQINIASLPQMVLYDAQKYPCSFSNNFLLCNTGNNISKVIITNLANKEFWQLLPNEIQYLQFSSEINNEEVKLKIERIMADGLVFVNYQTFTLNKKTRGDCVDHRLVSSDIAFMGDNSVVNEFKPTTSHADYHIYYRYKSGSTSVCEDKIKKPIIICDGYDAGDTRNYKMIYDDKLQFFKSSINKPVAIGEELRKKGYDVIILNFPILGTAKFGNGDAPPDIDIPDAIKMPVSTNIIEPNTATAGLSYQNRDGGADYIQRNAMIVVKLIQTINAEVKANLLPLEIQEKLVIVGPSMGGQVTRYALAYMEKQDNLGVLNMKHNCRQWVSFDSPHEGATVPMGTQCAIRWFAKGMGKSQANKNWNTNMMSPAFMQMIIEQKQNTGTYFTNGSLPMHQKYYIDLNSNGVANSHGYPQLCRKVTLLNGSGSGANNYSPTQTFLAMDAWMYYIAANIHIWDYQRFMNTPNNSNKVYQFRYFHHIFWVPFYFSHHNEPFNDNQRGTMDVVQGSTTPLFKVYRNGFDKSLNHVSWPVGNIDAHSFIPSVSAMGFKQSPTNWHIAFNNRNLLCGTNGSEIYFDNYYLPPTNEDHISFTEKSYKWAEQEIDKGHNGLDCVPEICDKTITGKTVLCNGASTTYMLGNSISNQYSCTWTCSPGLSLSNQTVSPTQGITVKGNYGGNGWLKCTITNPCGVNWVLEKNIAVHDITLPDIYITNGNCAYEFKTDPVPTGLVSKWSEDNFSTISTTGISGGWYPKNLTQKIWLKNVSSQCGSSPVNTTTHYQVLINCPHKKEEGQAANFANQNQSELNVYPNPTSNSWKVTFKDLDNLSSISCNLFDINGKQIWHAEKSNFVNNSSIIEATSFAKGFYILKVVTDDSTEIIKLIKE